jgi:hypothetical protein
VPTGLTATASGSNINLSWTASTGSPTGYNILRSTVSGGPYTTIGNVAGTTASDNGLSAGTYFYVVNAFNSSGTSANSAQASALIVALSPAATLNPSTINFGPIVQGVTSAALTVTITSSGTSNLILASSNAITISGANAPDFAVAGGTCANGTSLAPAGTCTITVTFTPSTTSSEVASLVVVSNDPSSPDTVSLSGTGSGAVTVSPISINFGNSYNNKTSSARTVTLTNSSGSTITFTSVTLTTGTQFALSGNTCTGTLANGNSCTVNVSFTPTSIGNKADTLNFAYTGASGSPQTVALTGKGTKRNILKVGSAVKWRYNPGAVIIRI